MKHYAIESSPRVAAHRLRTEQENEIRGNKSAIIQRLTRELEFARGQYERTLAKVSAFESTAWYSKLWLAIKQAFGNQHKILE